MTAALPEDDELNILWQYLYHDQGEAPESIDGRSGFGTWITSSGSP